MSSDDYERGLALMREMFGEEILDAAEMEDLFPGEFSPMEDWSVELLFGQVWNREELSTRDRSLANVAALTVLDKPDELRLHVQGALNNGMTRQEIAEVIMQMAFYGGWPSAVEAMRVALEVFEGDSEH